MSVAPVQIDTDEVVKAILEKEKLSIRLEAQKEAQ